MSARSAGTPRSARAPVGRRAFLPRSSFRSAPGHLERGFFGFCRLDSACPASSTSPACSEPAAPSLARRRSPTPAGSLPGWRGEASEGGGAQPVIQRCLREPLAGGTPAAVSRVAGRELGEGAGPENPCLDAKNRLANRVALASGSGKAPGAGEGVCV